MTKTFDEAYARYLSSLARLDATNDIVEKNVLFKQLTEQLSKMEEGINNQGGNAQLEDSADDDADVTC
jgi:hypothetical protein